MELKLYNTLGRQIQPFEPLQAGQVSLYACGPTVYSTSHIGNMRTYIFEDILRRTLEFNDLTVNHIMNVTDVGHLTSDADEGEDKIEKAARSEHRSALDIAREHEREFFNDLELLNIEKPTNVIRATETIDWQIDLITKLEAKGVTYKTSDGIYFDTAKFPRYGELSGQKLQDKKAGARVEANSAKHNPTDFALWKFSKPEDKRQMEWPSPWGTGFPGWHIECSAMSMHELGDQFDIHCGGIDHIAVHHENEIAQSEAITGKIPANFWMHGEFLVTDKRMGKSEGNAVTLKTLQDKGINPLAFRYLCLLTHYQKPLTFTWSALQAGANGLENLYEKTSISPVTTSSVTDKDKDTTAKYKLQFQNSINDNLNTTKALAVVNLVLSSQLPPDQIQSLVIEFDDVLGLGIKDEIFKRVVTLSDAQHISLIDREQAKKTGDYKLADQIRDEFLGQGIEIVDTPDGTKLRNK